MESAPAPTNKAIQFRGKVPLLAGMLIKRAVISPKAAAKRGLGPKVPPSSSAAPAAPAPRGPINSESNNASGIGDIDSNPPKISDDGEYQNYAGTI